MAFWQAELAGASLSHLPTDYIRPIPLKSVDAQIDRHATHIDFDKLLGVLLILVSKFTGDLDVSIGCSNNDRHSYVARHKAIKFDQSLQTLYDEVTRIRSTAQGQAEAFLTYKETVDQPLYHVRCLQGKENGVTFPVDIDLTVILDEEDLTIAYNSLLFSSQRTSILLDQILFLYNVDSSAIISEISTITDSQSHIIPDPTHDLDWTGYRGAIPTIFSSNAAAHPDRPCVVVTDAKEGDITYTYDQIHRQSNALANHLVASGIQKGDVVVIYAFRGADLMVAVMGILKAGATFSVIDPAYPETRQCIYLDVARPRGLIVLRKAGKLSDHVTRWIQDNLEPLVVNISDLELSSDGQSMVGIPHNTSQANTNIDIGPDDIPTLSFTSGSEGVPKGVRGRHFSLAHYFPWMAKHFNLSGEDRFTMLSGIAHDPIQRDMFTPLFLGATLVVPTADDIGTPGRLAEWCDKQKVTVTHLTPAMGQLLSSQVAAGVQIPSLRNAFFVGDVLTKRDVKRLQGLARHVDIINMYGTTETQRAVSYYRIPSVEKDSGFLNTCKDIMPAGTGMQNVQLLVVSRDGSRRICGVGEVGEIFVRAGGLAEGYLSLDEVTAQKFVKSWFVNDNTWSSKSYTGKGLWKGVRDRLYRSGDLGRYMPDGNVECCGRADDQVKIRGFRIELGEIDTHLSRHPLVRENITLLKRNKDEEPTLVSYFVPDKKSELQQFINSEYTKLKRLTVLISGSGSNLQALIDSTVSGVLKGKAKITHVISNRKNAYGLERAQRAGISTTVWSLAASRKRLGNSREQYDTELARLILEPGEPDLVICAGFMHILSVDFLKPMSAARVGIINLHPALPGQFNGAQAIERAFDAFQSGKINETGIMIHWVIAEVDMGEPILIQKIPIESGTSLENLKKHIHAAEHKLIVDATDKIISKTQQDTLVQRMQKYQPLVRDIREYLKGKLAAYAVPSVYVPMDKMPLNPNGKVDKPALPYPDTAQQSAATKSNVQNGELTPTQQKMHDIWREVLPQSPATIPVDENFFDLGGHSILATKLIFQIRKAFVMDDLSLGLIFKAPTIAQLSREVDQLRAGDAQTEANEAEYAKDADSLLESISQAYPTRHDINDSEDITVFLTGATGFLGTFIMRELLGRKNIKRVITHVRAKDQSSARTRLTETLKGYGIYDSNWTDRIDVVAGDLALPRLGLSEESWTRVLEVDCIIHNGALVHWVYPYSQLRAANVSSTLSCLELCSLGRPKTMTFVSSTSVLDTQHYVLESDRLIAAGQDGIPESDTLSGSKQGLGTGYGQSKWVSEFLCREAGRRGLRGSIVRPGYVVSDSQRGIMNTDDFLVRLMKGCIQIGKYPAMTNCINMVPVDHVARCVVASSMNSLPEFSVGHVTSHPRLRFIDFLSSLEVYGYPVKAVDYIPWKTALEEYVQSNEEQNALFPLLHFVTSDLPASTKAPELDDSNMRTILARDERFSGMNREAGMGVDVGTMGIAIAFLVKVGYLPAPTTKGRVIPEIEYAGTYTGGRASAAK